ncbi:MAG: MogA/MoaB family molybdenum cofactor biosynthesis protein [Sulfobacillus sp.]
MLRTGVLTISTLGARGARPDSSGALCERLLEHMGHQVVWRLLVPDDQLMIQGAICQAADELHLDVLITTGGTGLSPRDLTPEATAAVVERQVPGLAELIRLKGLEQTSRAALSRAICGVRAKTLVINLAGSPAAVENGLGAVGPLLAHVAAIIQDQPTDHSHPEPQG